MRVDGKKGESFLQQHPGTNTDLYYRPSFYVTILCYKHVYAQSPGLKVYTETFLTVMVRMGTKIHTKMKKKRKHQ